MYSEIGDAPAFERVKRHFDVVISIVRELNGAVVKTIGDSVMAVFVDPRNAIKAGFKMKEEVDKLGLALKVGINSGPCIAINQNDVLDYFGTTVNLAARIESQSNGDVVMSKLLFESSGIAELIKGKGAMLQMESVPIKGFANNIELVRLR
jgi:class 3 adenylate cyclase